VEAFRRKGERIPTGNPLLEGLLASAIQFVRTGVAGVSHDVEDPTGRRSLLFLLVVFDPDAERDIALGYRALEIRGTYLADEYGGTTVHPPEWFEGRVAVPLGSASRLPQYIAPRPARVSIPTAAVHSAAAPLRFAA
jgi:hypothetical protein